MATAAKVSRDKAQTALARLLLERVKQDKHPSATELDLLEQTMPRSLYRDYVTVLLAKVADGRPSVSMLARIQRFSERL